MLSYCFPPFDGHVKTQEDRKLEKAVEANNGLENDPKNGSEADWAVVARKLSTDRTAGECRSR